MITDKLFLKKAIISSFFGLCDNTVYVKTSQGDSPYMQIADLFSYFELIKHKIQMNDLTKSELSFFGYPRKIKKNFINQLKNKFFD